MAGAAGDVVLSGVAEADAASTGLPGLITGDGVLAGDGEAYDDMPGPLAPDDATFEDMPGLLEDDDGWTWLQQSDNEWALQSDMRQCHEALAGLLDGLGDRAEGAGLLLRPDLSPQFAALAVSSDRPRPRSRAVAHADV